MGDDTDVVAPIAGLGFPAAQDLDVDLILGGSGDDIILTGSFTGLNGNGVFDPGEANIGATVTNTVWAGSGDDRIIGTDGNERLGAGEGSDTVMGEGGDDTLYGGKGEGRDSLPGGAGNDLIFNGCGNDTVDGGAGNDTLRGGGGDDLLTGGTGADIFKFTQNTGHDTITDFDAGEDMLDVTLAGFADLAALKASATEVGSDVQISFADTIILMEGISLNDLTHDPVEI